MTEGNQQNPVTIDPQVQKELNTPLNASGVDPKDQEFLEIIMGLVKAGKINLYVPDTLINHPVYDKLDEVKRGKVDVEAFNLLSAIREIKGLYEAGYTNTYQIQNLVQRVRNTKERLEIEDGDLFII